MAKLGTKTIYLIRHAESLQNVAMSRMSRGDVKAGLAVAQLGHDAPLSQEGYNQIKNAKQKLSQMNYSPGGDNSPVPELVLHSNLERARETAMGIFPKDGSIPLLELPFIFERTIFEYAMPSGLGTRIQNLHTWLCSREESVVAIVGHGQFFKMWLRLTDTQHNLSCIKCAWSSDEGLRISDPTVLRLGEGQASDFI
jgi:phosphohistidine phosphatase SixA